MTRSIPRFRFTVTANVEDRALSVTLLGGKSKYRKHELPATVNPFSRYSLMNLWAFARNGNGERAATESFQRIREQFGFTPCTAKCAATPGQNVGWLVPSVHEGRPPACWHCGCEPTNGGGNKA